MDRGQFDALARLVSTRQSRRAALASALAATVLRSGPDAALAKRQAKGKGKGKDKSKRPCFPGQSCQPGAGKKNAGCDFSGSLQLHRRNVQGAHLAGANLGAAHLVGADLQGADLGGACLVDTNLRDANLDGSTLDDALFCGTVMPDGAINNRDCGRPTRCCPTEHPPGAGDRGVAFQSIKNNTQERTFKLDLWYFPVGYANSELYWHYNRTHHLTPGETIQSILPYRKQAIYVDDKYWIYIQNLWIGAPLGQLGEDGSISERDGWKNYRIVQDRSMLDTGTEISEFIDHVLINLRKIDDNSNNINWSLQIQTLSGEPD